MDPSLLREREKFQEKAKAQPAVEKKKKKSKEKAEHVEKKPEKKPEKKERKKKSKTSLDYKKTTPSSNNKLTILAKIISYMKKRHQEGELTHSLTLDEILEETGQTDITLLNKHWLNTEALPKNDKLKCTLSNEGDAGNKYAFKPKLDIKNKKQLLELLENNNKHGLGGVLYNDVEEALPDAAKAVAALGDQVTQIVRPDKKKVLFYNDKSVCLDIDEDLKKLWRSCTVNSLEDGQIEEYLTQQGITSMKGMKMPTPAPPIKRKPVKRKSKAVKTCNTHMEGILEDYSDQLDK